MILQHDAFQFLPTVSSGSFDTFIGCLWAKPEDDDIDELVSQALRIARHNVIFEFVGLREFGRVIVRATGTPTTHIVWAKTNHTGQMSVHRRPMDNIENVLVLHQPESFYRDVITYVDRTSHGAYGANTEGTRHQMRIWHAPAPRYEMPRNLLTMDIAQPQHLVERLLYTYTPPGGRVLEIGAGCGSGWRAARTLGLTYVGIERNPRQIATANRWMEMDPVEPVENLDAYMTSEVTRHQNAFCDVHRRVARP